MKKDLARFRDSREKKSSEEESVFILEEHWEDVKQFSFLCFVKYLLTEGEKLIISFVNTFPKTVTSEFSLVANLISLVCRFFF